MKLSSCLLILTALATPLRGLAAASTELTEALRIIRAVGPEGQGNAAASRAWKDVLARNDAADLLPVLTRDEQVQAVKTLGLSKAYRRLTGDRS